MQLSGLELSYFLSILGSKIKKICVQSDPLEPSGGVSESFAGPSEVPGAHGGLSGSSQGASGEGLWEPWGSPGVPLAVP